MRTRARELDCFNAIMLAVRESEALEVQLHIGPAEVAGALDGGAPPRLIDARTPGEWAAGHLPGAQLLTSELTFEILDSWPKNAPLVLYSNHGRRSLERASFFRAYGLTRAKSMDGGLQAWPVQAIPTAAPQTSLN